MKNKYAHILPILGLSLVSPVFGQDQTFVNDDGSIGLLLSSPDGNYEYIHLDNPPPPQPEQPQRGGPPPAGAPGQNGAQQPQPPTEAPDGNGRGRPGDGRPGGRGGRPQVPENRNADRAAMDKELQGPFFFVDEAPAQVIQTLEVLLGKSILQAQALPQVKINFISKNQMTREEAITALKSLLALNGIAISPLDDKFLRAIPLIGVGRQSPEFIKGSALALPPSQVFCCKLFELEYIDVSSIQGKIKNLMSVDGTGLLETFPRSNSMLITDSLVNIQNIESILKKIDLPLSMTEEIVFVQIKNVGAADIRERLTTLQGDALRKYFEKTSVDVDTRTNQLVIVTQRGNIDHIKKIIEGLDIKAEPLLKNEVILVRHCKAAEIETVLKTIITQQQQQLSRAARERRETISAAARDAAVRANAMRNTGNQNQEVAAKIASATPSGLDASGASSGLEFSDYVQVVSHESSSSIVVYGTESDIRQLKDIAKRLDVAIDQVRVDVIITEVNLTDGQVSGLSSFGMSYNMPSLNSSDRVSDSNVVAVTGGSDTLGDSNTQAFQFGISEDAFFAMFNVARQNQNVKVLSTPTVVTTHGKQAQIKVLETYPTVESSTYDISNPTASRNSYTDMEIGIQLTVTPYVGTDGIIRLEIQQKVDSIARYVELDGNTRPVVNVRNAESIVSVKNNQVIVLGGLQQTDVSDTEGSVWLLGDIPLIGNLFSPAKSSTKRRELIIFVRPRIMHGSSLEEMLSNETLKDSFVEREVKNYLRDGQFYSDKEIKTNAQEFEDNRFYNKAFKDPEAFIKNERTVLDGSTKSHDKKNSAQEDSAKNENPDQAPLEADQNEDRGKNIEKESGDKALRSKRTK